MIFLLQIAGVPGVTEALFLARQSALAEQKKKLDEAPMLYSCGICGKDYKSSKAHAQHLNSKTNILQAAQRKNLHNDANAIVRPMTLGNPARHPYRKHVDDKETEWEEIDSEVDMNNVTANLFKSMNINENSTAMTETDDDEDDFKELNPTCCFMCDLVNDSLESCMVHMHKMHGFFIPDLEYLNDPKGSPYIPRG